MEGVPSKIEGGHLRIGNSLPFGIGPTVDLTPHAQPRGGARGANQADDDGETHQRLPAPVRADVGEQPVLDLFHLLVPGGK